MKRASSTSSSDEYLPGVTVLYDDEDYGLLPLPDRALIHELVQSAVLKLETIWLADQHWSEPDEALRGAVAQLSSVLIQEGLARLPVEVQPVMLDEQWSAEEWETYKDLMQHAVRNIEALIEVERGNDRFGNWYAYVLTHHLVKIAAKDIFPDHIKFDVTIGITTKSAAKEAHRRNWMRRARRRHRAEEVKRKKAAKKASMQVVHLLAFDATPNGAADPPGAFHMSEVIIEEKPRKIVLSALFRKWFTQK